MSYTGSWDPLVFLYTFVMSISRPLLFEVIGNHSFISFFSKRNFTTCTDLGISMMFFDVLYLLLPFKKIPRKIIKIETNCCIEGSFSTMNVVFRLGIHVKQILSCPDISHNKYCHVQILVTTNTVMSRY